MVSFEQLVDYVNPAEFLADLISIDYSSTESVKSSQMRIDRLVESFSKRIYTLIYETLIDKEVVHKNEKRIGMRTVAKKKGGWWKQFWLLLRRSWMQNPVNHRVFERKLRPKPSGRGHACLGVTQRRNPSDY
ncbi:hypothetical protein K1719_029674 [Acacia pycnantha]|nr:hypothetical protein K1719_029674 [Acacia pycnantha]